MNNPFLSPFHTPFDVPPFTQIETIHYLPALKEAIGKAHAEIAKITGNHEPPTFENTIETLEECGEAVGRIASVLFNLNSAETNDALQQVAQEASPLLTQFDNDIKQNKRLFERVSFVHMQLDFLSLTTEQKTLLEKTYKSFVRSGAGLSEEAKKRYSEIDTELARLTLTFGENVLAETNHFELVIEDKAQLSGLPEDVVRRASELATEKGKEGSWVFTLQAPSYVPFMEYADNRALREQMFKAYMTKAFKGDKYDNQQLAKDIAALRAEKAALLGYESYAAFILEERMALSPANVENFLLDLLEKARPKAVEEVEEIKEFMRSLGATHALERWDWSYYSEKLRKKKFDLDDELIKPYFQLENVIEGVFATAGRLYGITFVPNDQIPVYHPDVAAYEVKNEAGETIALFLTDFFPRKGKRPGAWMTAYRDQKKIKGVHQVPIISIVCNFTPSSPGHPSLLKFDEVKTLFHEFGHALHGMLADTTYGSLSGTSVYWDFVELPSQIFENWCNEKECLDLFARHYQTKEPIPQAYIDSLNASANYHEAYMTLRQLSFGLLDMAYHHQSREMIGSIKDIEMFEMESMKKTDLFPRVPNTCMSVQFAHIFAGGYGAGYYSYKWAEVLDADAFVLFKERGVFDRETARSFRDNILSKGGTDHPMTLYKQFRGQEPTADALLRRAGLI